MTQKANVSGSTSNSELSNRVEWRDFDPLTGTLTRHAFLERMTEAAEVARDAFAPFSICLIDVDQLRNVNELHGQRVGDEVLLEIASRLRGVLSRNARHANAHLLARYDGASFVLLAQKSDQHESSTLAERVRAEVAAMPIAGNICVTVSVGVAQHRIGESTDHSLARAEQALHLAKQFGRDRVEVAAIPDQCAEPGAVIPWERTA